MWLLPMALRAKVAAVVLLGIFFIPFATSDLRGLTHVLSCSHEVATSLYVDGASADADAVLGSADAVARGDDGQEPCGGLEVDLELSSTRGDRAEVLVSITNTTDDPWRGSVELDFDGAPVPVAIGRIDPGDTGSDTVTVRVPEGRTYEITGTLLIGP